MERLTTSQISDFNNPLAFARDREARVGQATLDSRSSQNIRTGDREASFRLIKGATERLETMRANLQSMLELSRSGQRSTNNARRTEEIYGKLRSLSAGFDQVVDSVRFDGKPIFEGNQLTLAMGSGSRPLTLETSKLLTHGEGSLNLSNSRQTAEITVFETVDDVILNQNTDFTGVRLAGASYIEGSNPALELDNTNYKVQIQFTGNNSAVEIRDRLGTLVERREGVDLSGRGREFVDFDSGVRLEIEKEPLLDQLNDLDFTIENPIEINSSILYRRVDTHTLRNAEGAQSDTPDGASLLFGGRLGNAETGQLTVSDPQLTPPADRGSALESGFYNMNIDYRGENSTVRLTDALGRIRGFKFGVDLTGERNTLTFDGGLSVTVENTGLKENGNLQIPIELNRRPPAIEEFDFRKYTRQIENAMEVVETELEKMLETKDKIQEINTQRNPNARENAQTAASLSASNSLNILSGGGSGPLSILNGDPSQQLSQAANSIFASTSALQTQATQTPEQLRSLQQASAANLLGSALGQGGGNPLSLPLT
ncbi:MAG: hypothetical protein LAT55_00615 [Opitutales bacterium]|nr:hypothetical protein [Opitutales bacterium]